MRQVSEVLAMDRTTLTAAFKPLERRGLVRVLVDPDDRRGRRIAITDAGRDALAAAGVVLKDGAGGTTWERSA